MNPPQVFGTTLVFGGTQEEVRNFQVKKKETIHQNLVYLFPVFDERNIQTLKIKPLFGVRK